MDCLPSVTPWKIPESEIEERTDFRRDCVFTIDPATARDLDDALSIEDLGEGTVWLGVLPEIKKILSSKHINHKCKGVLITYIP